MAEKACIFCGGTPVNREHAVPSWVSKALKRDPRGSPQDLRLQRDDRISEWTVSKEINVTVKCVCHDCNHGWMARMEEQASPILRRMMSGQAVTLDTEAQTTVARWMALRALIFRYINNRTPRPEAVWLTQFFAHQLPPATCYIWLTAYNGDKAFQHHDETIAVTRYPDKPRKPTWETPNGMVMTLIIGYLVANLLWIRKGQPGNSDPIAFVRIWPVNATGAQWPPSAVFNDVTVETIKGRFLS